MGAADTHALRFPRYGDRLPSAQEIPMPSKTQFGLQLHIAAPPHDARHLPLRAPVAQAWVTS